MPTEVTKMEIGEYDIMEMMECIRRIANALEGIEKRLKTLGQT